MKQVRLMIQRKQTLFLLAAALLCGLSFVFPIARYIAPAGGQTYELMTSRVFDPVNAVTVEDAPLKYPIHVVYALLGVALLVDIFLFKNRKRQLLILRSVYIFGALAIVLQLVTHQSAFAYLKEGRGLESSFGPTMFFPIHFA